MYRFIENMKTARSSVDEELQANETAACESGNDSNKRKRTQNTRLQGYHINRGKYNSCHIPDSFGKTIP